MNNKKFTKVIPAILPKDYNDLVSHLDMVQDLVPVVQVDVVDGKFAPNKTWPYVNDSSNQFLKFVNQDEGLPYWDAVDFEVDLMVADPAFVADQWIAAGASRVVVHIASLSKEAFIRLAQSVHDKGVEFRAGVEIGMMEKAEEYFEELQRVLKEKDFTVEAVKEKGVVSGIQCMGITSVGFQHQEFNPDVLKTISYFRNKYPDVPIAVDGGVSLETAGPLFDAGATELVSGSAVFESENIIDTLEHFEEIF